MAIPDVNGKSIAELLSLKGRNAVVTGGARGIGLAICQRLAEAGANIVVGDVREDLGKEAVEHLAQHWGVKALCCVADGVMEHQLLNWPTRQYRNWVALISGWMTLVLIPSDPVLEMPDEQWDRV